MKTHFKIPIIIAGVIIVIGSLAVLGLAFYQHTAKTKPPLVFSNNEMLLDMWRSYKKDTIEQSTGRTIDKSQGNISTSEGESYTMLRSVWMDDRGTFDKSWTWTQDYLQRKDNLLSWRYGPLNDGTGRYGIQTAQGGENTASDGDSDTALALLMAYKRWNDPKYVTAAKEIISSMWKHEVVMVAGKPVLTADNLETNRPGTVTVNPSYFSPYAYRLFAQVDPSNDWMGLVDNSYAVLGQVMTDKLGSTKSVGLPPDWVMLDRKTGAATPPSGSLTTNYGYDAMRVPWRLALDYQWYHDSRDKSLIDQMSFLKTTYQQTGKLMAGYAHDGTATENYESASMYGTAIGALENQDPGLAKKMYTDKLLPLYNPDTQAEIENLGYYDANWGWFGIALAQNALPNIAAQ